MVVEIWMYNKINKSSKITKAEIVTPKGEYPQIKEKGIPLTFWVATFVVTILFVILLLRDEHKKNGK